MIRFSPKYFVLPILAFVVIGSLPAPADSGRAGNGSGCGPAISTITDPGMRAAFERFDRTQSAAAAKICALYRNSMDTVVSHDVR
jgi:hypothetical protein